MNTVEAFELFNSVLDDNASSNDGDQTCLISRLPLDNTRVTFPCLHTFNYAPLLSDLISYARLHGHSRLRCPYCRTPTNGVIPYRPDVSKKTRIGINAPTSSCFEKHDCSFTGCAKNATVPVSSEGTYACSTHYRKFLSANRKSSLPHPSNSVVPTCVAILKTGARKGSLCGAKTVTGLCKRHTPK